MNEWIERDLKVNWHPYTQMKECEKLPPIMVARTEAMKIYDDQGNWYYDTISSWWCNIHGHRHPDIMEAIKKQTESIDHVLFAGFSHKPAIELAEKLVEISPEGLDRVFYSDNGSTAVEVAMKMAVQYWQNIGKTGKTKFVSLDQAYHGDTIGTMGVGGEGVFIDRFASLFVDNYKVPTPYAKQKQWQADFDATLKSFVDPLEELLSKKSDEIAAMLIEPMVLGAAGMVIYPAEYLSKVRRLTEKYNVLLIADEVAVGFGRTGRLFACEHANVVPDIMAISKGISSGTLPISATLTTNAIYETFLDDSYSGKTFFHGHTYTANPIACAASIASIAIFDKERSLEKVPVKAKILENKFNEFMSYEFVADVRVLGMIAALELDSSKLQDHASVDLREMVLSIYRKGLEHNILLRPMGNVIYLYLPLSITEQELEDVLSRLSLVLAEILSF